MPRGKKQCPLCKEFVGIRTSKCSCGYVFVKAKKEKKLNKFHILSSLVKIPEKNKRPFYLKEFKMMKVLAERYSLEFLSVVDFGKKFDSLAYIVSPKLRETMDKKWRAFNYKFDNDKYEEYTIGDKIGQDKEIKKQIKTTKDFLNE